MPEKNTKSLHKRLQLQVLSTTNICDEWCRVWRIYDRLLPTAFLLGILLFLLYFVTLAPPLNFPGASLVKVEKGETITSVAQTLKAKHLIRSTALFILIAKLYGSHGRIVDGEYFFPSAENVLEVGRRLAHGDFELVPIKVTIPEGSTTYQIANILTKKIPDFDKQGFLEASQSKEGYLFPDTYFFVPGEEPILIVTTFENNFKKKLDDASTTAQLQKSGKTLRDVITMASLLEKEANDTESRRIIAGILWHRIRIGMALQVDAVFPYIIGKNSFNLTKADLKIDSPYNTYTNKGLPPGAIANPGLDSILATLNPIPTNYLFYLSDLHGTFHYSKTYPEQLANQRLYLK